TGGELFAVEEKEPAQTSGPFRSVAFSPDGQWVAATNPSGDLLAWNATTGQERFPPVRAHVVPKGSKWVTRTAFIPDGRFMVTTNENEGIVKLWEAETGKSVAALGQGVGFSQVTFSPSGRWVAAAGTVVSGWFPDPGVWIWDSKTRQTRGVFRGPA